MRGSVIRQGRSPGMGPDYEVARVTEGPESQDAMNGQTLQYHLTITGVQGLHMRPAAAFAERAQEFKCAVTVRKADKRVDGKSVWDLMMLAADQGSELTVEAAGTDAADALKALVTVLVDLEV